MEDKVLALAKQTEMKRMFCLCLRHLGHITYTQNVNLLVFYVDFSYFLCFPCMGVKTCLYDCVFSRDVWEYFQTSVENVERQTLRIRASGDQCLHCSLISPPVLLMREKTILQKEKCAVSRLQFILVNNAGEICAWHAALVEQTYICIYT